MVGFTCPWCEDYGLIAFEPTDAPEASFTCAECGTTVSLVTDEATEYLELAA